MISPPPALLPEELHVWLMELSLDEERIGRLSRVLNKHEMERADRFIPPRARQHFIAARGQLRTIIASYLSVEPHELDFSYGPHGKPDLSYPEKTTIRFNLSHSGELGLLAINLHHSIGTDIEQQKANRDFLKLSERFFSIRERTDLKNVLPAMQREAFYACWTRKEAYLKAIGTGLATPLDSFDVTLVPDNPPELIGHRIDPAEPRRWKLLEIPVPYGYRAAVATRWENPSLTIICSTTGLGTAPA